MLSRLSIALCLFVGTSLASCAFDDSEATTEWSTDDIESSPAVADDSDTPENLDIQDIESGPAAADDSIGTENADLPCHLIDVFRDICASGGDCTQYMCCSFGGPFCPVGA